jgi:hypothetical protein
MATINDIGIPGVGSGILHPKQKNRWRVTFANMGGGGSDSQPLSMQAVTVMRPTLSFAEVPLHRYNSIDWVAGKHSWEPMTLTLEDDVTGTASRVIQDQIQSQQWLIGAEGQWLAARGEGSLYKFVTILDQLDGNDVTIEEWIMESCWFNNINYGELDYSTGDQVTIEVTIRFGHARQVLGGYDQGQGVATGGPGPNNVQQ